MHHSHAFIVTGAFVFIASCGTHEVKQDPKNLLVGKGAEYYLPKTVLVTTVPVIKKVQTPGRFHFFSLPLLDVKPDVNVKQAISFRLGKPITIDSIGEPDTTQKFVSLYRKGPFQTFNQSYQWNNGILTHGEATVENKTVEFVVSTLEAAVKVAGAAAAAADRGLTRPGLSDLRKYLCALDPANTSGFNDEDLEKALDFGLSLKDPMQIPAGDAGKAGAAKWADFITKSGPALLEIIAAMREVKKVLAKADSLNLATDSAALEQQKNALIELQSQFVGTTKETTWLGQFRYCPPDRAATAVTGSMADAVTLIQPDSTKGIDFPAVKPEQSPSSGFLSIKYKAPPSDSVLGIVASQLGDSTTEALPASVRLSWQSSIPDSTAAWQSALGKPAAYGWRYRVPAPAVVKIRLGSDDLEMKRLFIAQHGCVGCLPATSRGQTFVSNIDLDPVTGALKSATHGGKAFDPGLVNRVGAATAEAAAR